MSAEEITAAFNAAVKEVADECRLETITTLAGALEALAARFEFEILHR
jgi:hypothetical protein